MSCTPPTMTTSTSKQLTHDSLTSIASRPFRFVFCYPYNLVPPSIPVFINVDVFIAYNFGRIFSPVPSSLKEPFSCILLRN